MRLDRFVCLTTGYSRSESQRLIKTGRVRVDQTSVISGKTLLCPQQQVYLDEQELQLPGHRYFMLYKPSGYVCTTEGADHPIVFDLLQADTSLRPFISRLQIVGRLDLDTTGLLLLTDDGQWNHRVTSPRNACTKIYRVELASPPAEKDLAKLELGVMLRNETRPTLPCKIQHIDERCVTIELSEGRYHQVKRMFASIGNRVTTLHRLQIGDIVLDPMLQPGQVRELTEAEIASV